MMSHDLSADGHMTSHDLSADGHMMSHDLSADGHMMSHDLSADGHMIDINNHMMCFPQMSLLPGLYWNICLMEISNHFSWSVNNGFTLASVTCDINLQLRMS